MSIVVAVLKQVLQNECKEEMGCSCEPIKGTCPDIYLCSYKFKFGDREEGRRDLASYVCVLGTVMSTNRSSSHRAHPMSNMKCSRTAFCNPLRRTDVPKLLGRPTADPRPELQRLLDIETQLPNLDVILAEALPGDFKFLQRGVQANITTGDRNRLGLQLQYIPISQSHFMDPAPTSNN